jgi:hypothetical protein
LFARITFICGALLLDIFFLPLWKINKGIYLWKNCISGRLLHWG